MASFCVSRNESTPKQ